MSRKMFFSYYIPLFFGTFLMAFLLSFVSSKLSNVFAVITIWPLIAVRAKRMHDWGRSGWWQIPYNILDGFTIVGGTLVMGLWPPKTEGNKYLNSHNEQH